MSPETAGLVGALIGAAAGVGGGAVAQLVSSYQARRALLRHLAAEYISDLEKVRIGAILLNADAATGSVADDQSPALLQNLDQATRRANDLSMNAGRKVKGEVIATLGKVEEVVLLAPQLWRQDPRWVALIDAYQKDAHGLQDFLYEHLGK